MRLLGIVEQELEADDAAERKGDDMRLVDAEMIEQLLRECAAPSSMLSALLVSVLPL